MGDKITDLRNEIRDLKASRNPVLVAATKQWAADLQFEVDQLKSNLVDAKRQCLEMCLGSPLLEKAKVNSKPFFRHIFLEVLDP
ncbi:hypothetical protein B296_00014157 [Ensete ventricosum]|uniref:Uncharacterized protein n=1 Tax=Ensete ventricosum TaxID=4639 RepID=A0A427ANH1_ENSVE|nr:hypothetical protein B296_00014157 [Ensete ventricosum]